MNKDTFSFPVTIPELFIPPSYDDLLKSKDIKELRDMVNRYIYKGRAQSRSLFGKTDEKEHLTSLLKDFFMSVTNIKPVFQMMMRDKFNIIMHIIRNRGFLFLKEVKKRDMTSIDPLIHEGLVFTINEEEKNYLTVPLEICLAIPLGRFEEVNSLLLGLNSYSTSVVKIMASEWNIKGKNAKLAVAPLLYTTLVRNYNKTFSDLTHDQYLILKEIFSRGGRVSSKSLIEWIRANDKSFKPSGSSYYRSYNDPIQSFLEYPRKSNLKDIESKMYRALLELIIKGVVCYYKKDLYGYTLDYFIPHEIYSSVSEVFFKEVDREFQEITKKMYTSAPEGSFSHASRVCDDLVKIQVAAVCDLIGRTQKGEVKKRSLTVLAKMLNVEEEYIDKLFAFFSFTRKGSDLYTLKNIEYNTFELFKKVLLKVSKTKDILSVINSYEPEWMNKNPLISSLLIHKKLFHLKDSLTRSGLENFVRECVLLGLLDSSQPGDRLRVKKTFLLHDIFDNKPSPKIPLIKAHEKPLVIQANLELLIPFNVEKKIITGIALFSDLKVIDKMLHFVLTRDSLMRAFDKGWDSERVKSTLRSLSTVDIPQSVKTFIDTIGAKRGEAEVMSCSALIRCTGLGIKEKILSLKGLKGLELVRVEGMDDFVLVRGRDVEEIVSFLKRKGIFAEIGDK